MTHWMGFMEFTATVLLTALVLRVLFASVRYWKFRITYTCFKTCSFEIPLIYQWVTGKLPQGTSFSRFFFNELISTCKRFEKEGIFLMWGLRPFVVVFHEEYVKALANDQAVINKMSLYDLFEEMINKGLIISNGVTWKTHRKLLNPAFRFDILKGYVSNFNENAKNIVKELAKACNKPTIEVDDILKTGSLRILCETLLEMNLEDGRHDHKLHRCLTLLSSLTKYTMYRVARPWFYFKHFQLLFRNGREHYRMYQEFHGIMRDIVRDIKDRISIQDTEKFSERSEESSSNSKSFVRILLENHLKDPSFTFEDVMGEITNIIFAGHDTTSHTMLWTLFLLGHHPQVQEKVYEEVESVVGNGTGVISYTDLNKLEYLESVIKETLRLYPVAPFFGRYVNKEIQLGKYKIPKNTCIVFSPFMLHRNPEHFPCPEIFDPERFYKNSLDHPWSFTPFSEGIRSCIGKKYAMMEMKIILGHLIRNFEITTLGDKDVPMEWSITLIPSEPVPFILSRRQTQSLPQG